MSEFRQFGTKELIFIYFQERQIQKGFQISKADAQGATDIFTMTAMKLKKQMSQASNTSFGTKRSGNSVRVKLTGKQKFKGLALKAIKQEHEEEGRSPAKTNDPIGRDIHLYSFCDIHHGIVFKNLVK